MKTSARANYVKISAQKVNLILDLIRKQSYAEADRRLKFTKRQKGGKIVRKLLHSAHANALQHNMNEDTLRVSHASVGPAPALKRWRPMGRGRVGSIRKRRSNILIELTDQEKNSK